MPCKSPIMHLSMNPLKQGLKHGKVYLTDRKYSAFIHESIKTRVETKEPNMEITIGNVAFIHESIKTRVETAYHYDHFDSPSKHLSMNPLKQGLKLPQCRV